MTTLSSKFLPNLSLSTAELDSVVNEPTSQVSYSGNRPQAITFNRQGGPCEHHLFVHTCFIVAHKAMQGHDAKLADAFYDSLEGILLDLRTVTLVRFRNSRFGFVARQIHIPAGQS